MTKSFYFKFLAVATFLVGVVLIVRGLDSWLKKAENEKLAKAAKVAETAQDIETLKVKVLALEVRVLAQEVEMNEIIHSDAKLTLARVSRCIESSDKGSYATCGSFSDFIVPELHEASRAGASKRDIAVLLDRVCSMAQNKKYYSSYVEHVDMQGPGQLKAYMDGLKAKLGK